MRRNGYTLIELLTTLGLATVLLTMAVPAMQKFRMNSRQTGEINELVSAMHLARNTAITTNTRVTFCASSNGQTCASVSWNKGWIAFIDRDSDQTVDADESILRTGSDVNGLTISSSQYSTYLMYRPNGRVMNSTIAQNSGQFNVCDGRGTDHAKAIVLDMSGRPRLADSSTSGVSISCS